VMWPPANYCYTVNEGCSLVGTGGSVAGRRLVARCGRGTFVALGSAVLPGHPAGEPFADPQHPLDVTNSCPPAFRA
jgi:hypothetical protein